MSDRRQQQLGYPGQARRRSYSQDRRNPGRSQQSDRQTHISVSETSRPRQTSSVVHFSSSDSEGEPFSRQNGRHRENSLAQAPLRQPAASPPPTNSSQPLSVPPSATALHGQRSSASGKPEQHACRAASTRQRGCGNLGPHTALAHTHAGSGGVTSKSFATVTATTSNPKKAIGNPATSFQDPNFGERQPARQNSRRHGHPSTDSSDSTETYTLEQHYDLLRQQAQLQMHMQRQRTAQASCQMVYNVFTWTIGTIEIMEYLECPRDQRERLSRTTRDMYKRMVENHHGKEINMDELIQQGNNYLLAMQIQLQSCDETIKGPVREELKGVVEYWKLTGEQKRTHSFAFKEQLASVLDGHPPQLIAPIAESAKASSTEPDGSTMGRVFGFFQSGLMATDKLEQSFQEDPTKEAQLPEFRQTYC